MTTFNVDLEIAGPPGTAFEAVSAGVDTGSTFTAAPRELLERLGVRPLRRQRFRLAGTRVIENEVGEARVRLEGEEGTTPVIFNFNEPGEPVLLGALTLEQFLLGVGPVRQRLVPAVGLRVSRGPA